MSEEVRVVVEPPTEAEREAGRLLFAQDCRFCRRRRNAGAPAAGRRAGGRLRGTVQCRQVEPAERADRPDDARPHLQHARPDPAAQLLRTGAGGRAAAGAGRPARLRLRQGAEARGRRLDPPPEGLSARPRHARPGLRAGRRAARRQAGRPRDHGHAGQGGGRLPGRADQDRQDRGRRAGRAGRAHRGRTGGAAGRAGRGSSRRRAATAGASTCCAPASPNWPGRRAWTRVAPAARRALRPRRRPHCCARTKGRPPPTAAFDGPAHDPRQRRRPPAAPPRRPGARHRCRGPGPRWRRR